MRNSSMWGLFLFACCVANNQAQADALRIKAKTTELRASPEFYAEALLELNYGDEVTRISEQKGWVKVSAGGYEGYVPLSAVTKSAVKLSGEEVARVASDTPDVVLAGKGVGGDPSGGASAGSSIKPFNKLSGLLGR